MLEGRVFDTIDAIAPEDWNGCFSDVLEGHAYHQAVEQAALPGFSFFYVAVYDQSRLVGVAPAFLTNYDLATTLDSAHLRGIIAAVKSFLPGFLRVRLAALGSPCTEHAMLGMADGGRSYGIADCVLRTFEDAARSKGGALIAIKDLSADASEQWRTCVSDLGYGYVSGLPSTHLPIDFTTIDGYLANLSPGTRRDMRRKLRPQALRTEDVHSLRPYAVKIMALYHATLSRAEMALEELTFDYFENVLTRMPGQAIARLYFSGDKLLAANLLLHNDSTLIDKYFLMAQEGRDHNLYFVSWFDNVRLCLEKGLSTFQTGQAAYANKLRLGVSLRGTHMAFKHKNALLAWLLRAIAPFLSTDLSVEALRHE